MSASLVGSEMCIRDRCLLLHHLSSCRAVQSSASPSVAMRLESDSCDTPLNGQWPSSSAHLLSRWHHVMVSSQPGLTTERSAAGGALACRAGQLRGVAV
eukprot:1680755-Alexandrium_andersonii.AAC.1